MELDSIRKGWLNGSFNLGEIWCYNLTLFRILSSEWAEGRIRRGLLK